MDFEYVPASPGSSRWAGESAARRRQRRLSSPSLRTYLTPAFDAVAGGEGGVSGYSSSSSSGGLELGFDASLLRYRRSCLAASADLDSRVLLYSPQSLPPPPPQMRAAYMPADDEVWAPGVSHYGSKHEVMSFEVHYRTDRRLLLCRFYVPWWTMLPQLAFAVALLLKGMYKYNDDACLGACRQLMPYWFPSLLVQAPCLRSFFSKTTNSLRLEKVGDWRENLDVAIVKLGLICSQYCPMAGRLTGAPGFQDSENRIAFVSPSRTSSNLHTTVLGASTPVKLPAELQLPEGSAELPTPKPEATPSALKLSADPEPDVDADEITEALYGGSGHRRLPIFREICPE
ncbi:hypothetical protein ZEAMMB73_Zm00001d006921 [Zea mays]|nr:hypothetical protein ZEAMMB73_Zm00001d006921 [Zea mays]